MLDKLEKAKLEYPKGTLFYSATKNLKTPLRVEGILKFTQHHKNTIVCESGGVIYTDGVWAEKVR